MNWTEYLDGQVTRYDVIVFIVVYFTIRITRALFEVAVKMYKGIKKDIEEL